MPDLREKSSACKKIIISLRWVCDSAFIRSWGVLMGTRKEKSSAFLWALVCALTFGVVACGDEASPTGAETPDSSSAAPEGGNFSTAFSSSSYYYWGFSSGAVIGTQPGDSLKPGDTLELADSISHDTEYYSTLNVNYLVMHIAPQKQIPAQQKASLSLS